MPFAVNLSRFGDATPETTTQPRLNSGLIGWLEVLPYLMGVQVGRDEHSKRLDNWWIPRPSLLVAPKETGESCKTNSDLNVLEAGRGSRPIPLLAGRKDTLNPVTGVFTAGVQSVQVCQAMSLRRNFLLCPQPCLKHSQNTTL